MIVDAGASFKYTNVSVKNNLAEFSDDNIVALPIVILEFFPSVVPL
jgi:hypothetical protein